jgi:hypothetical protein
MRWIRSAFPDGDRGPSRGQNLTKSCSFFQLAQSNREISLLSVQLPLGKITSLSILPIGIHVDDSDQMIEPL